MGTRESRPDVKVIAEAKRKSEVKHAAEMAYELSVSVSEEHGLRDSIEFWMILSKLVIDEETVLRQADVERSGHHRCHIERKVL